jgi:putative DNA primase/helicase
MTVQLNKKNIPVNDLINITVIFRLDPNYGAHLRYNVRKNRVEWRGEPCGKKEIARAHSYLKRAYGCTFYRPWVAEAMTDIAEEHAYDPVEEYLNERALWDGTPRREWFLNVLGAEQTPLNVAYLTCFLVGAVARALDKNKLGVQMDTALILKGPQGVGKTSIFRALGGTFHRGSRIDLNSKDRFSAVRGPWIVEWTELDETTSNAQQGSIKEFLTTMVDSYRPLYVNDEVEAPRRCVIVGTTNEDQFLRDGTGSRRFHVIETKDEVDTSLITAMRDQIWGEAVHLYRSGTKWWLTKEENELRAGASDTFQVEEVWEDRVRKYVNESVARRGEEKLYEITADEILTNCISKEVAHWSTKDRTRIGYILKGLGFSRTKVKGENSQYTRPRPAGNVVPLRPIYIPPEAPSRRATPQPKE